MTKGFPLSSLPTLVSVDAMFTIFKPRRGGRKRLICHTYSRYGGLHSQVSNKAIWEAMMFERHRFREIKSDADYWLHINLAIFRSLPATVGRHKSDYQAAIDVHRRITSDVSIYEPDQRIIRLIRCLREKKVRIVIGSNQEEASLRRLLKVHKIEDLFDAVYTSEGLQTRKPYPDFWEKILQIESKTIEETIHIGNSPNSDIGAARLGIRTLLWDPSGEIKVAIRSKKKFHLAHPDVDEKEFFRLLNGGLVHPFTTLQQAQESLCSPTSSSPTE